MTRDPLILLAHSCSLIMPYRKKRRVYRKRYGRRGGMRKRRRVGRGAGKARYNRKYDAILYKAPRPKGALGGAFPSAYFTKLPFKVTSTITGASNYSVDEFFPAGLGAVFGSADYNWRQRLLNLYNRWVCLGFSWKVTFHNLDPDSLINCWVLPWPANEDPTTANLIKFQTGVQQVMVGPAIGGGSAGRVISGYRSMKRLMGVNVVNEEEYWGNQSTEPTIQPRLYVAAENGSTPTSPEFIDFQYQLELIGYFKFFGTDLQPSGPVLVEGMEVEGMSGVPFCAAMPKGKVILGKNHKGELWCPDVCCELKEDL